MTRANVFANVLAAAVAGLLSQYYGAPIVQSEMPPSFGFNTSKRKSGLRYRLVMRLLSSGIRRRAKSRGVGYAFLFMKANGSQLREITRLLDAGVIRPVVDRVFPFEMTNEALAYVVTGRSKGKVVVKLR